MTSEKYEPTQAEILASIVTGRGSSGYMGAAVQRSHRFPYHLFVQIENMANAGGVPVSIIINQLIACGLEAVRTKLPDDIVSQLSHTSKEQSERPVKSISVGIKDGKLDTRKKSRPKRL
jgi:hypothetical protein